MHFSQIIITFFHNTANLTLFWSQQQYDVYSIGLYIIQNVGQKANSYSTIGIGHKFICSSETVLEVNFITSIDNMNWGSERLEILTKPQAITVVPPRFGPVISEYP